jgi:hypothetical protein
MDQIDCALSKELSIFQFLSSVQVADPRIKTEVQIIPTWGDI